VVSTCMQGRGRRAPRRRAPACMQLEATGRHQGHSDALSRTQRAHLRLVHVATVPKQLYERENGACRRDDQPILCGPVREHGEGLCGLHLRRGVPPFEEGHEGLDDRVAILLIRRRDVKDCPLSIPVKCEV
jgi:hypothetical protein